MSLKCKVCGEVISAENINLATNVASCTNCDITFPLAKAASRKYSWTASNWPTRLFKRRRQERLITTIDPQGFTQRPIIACPNSVKQKETGEFLRLTVRWYSHFYLIVAVLALLVDGLFIGGIVVNQAFDPFLLLVGLLLTYITLAGILNHTIIEVSKGRITVEHGPLSGVQPVNISVRSIKQIYVTEILGTSRKVNKKYRLNALLHNEKRPIVLLHTLTSRNENLYVEQEIERFLGIRNRVVMNEIL